MEETFFDLNSITLRQGLGLFIILLAVYVLIHVFGNRRVNRISNHILSFLLLQIILMETGSLLISLRLREIYLPLSFLNFPMLYFTTATCYLYIVSLTSAEFRVGSKHLLHFLFPGIVMLLTLMLNAFFYLPYLNEEISTFEERLNLFVDIQSFLFNYIFPLLFILYGVLTICVYRRYRKTIKNYFSFHEGVSLKWIQGFILGFFLYQFFLIISNNEHLFIGVISQSIYDLISYFTLLLFVGFVGYYGTRQVNYYKNDIEGNTAETIKDMFPAPTIKNDHTSVNFQKETVTKEEKTNDTVLLNESRKNELKEKIIALMNNERIFINESLTIEDIAQRLSTNSKYISHVINDCLKKNFYTFINEYRIREAEKLLSDPNYHYYSIEGIGKMSGFKSKSSFNTAFKKLTGKTPSEYKTAFDPVKRTS